MGADGALLAASMVARLQLSNCRFLRSGSGGILVSRCEDVAITGNIVDKAATGIAVTNVAQGWAGAPSSKVTSCATCSSAKLLFSTVIGISIDADAVVRGNRGGKRVRVSASSWVAGLRGVSITDNHIRNAHIGIGIPAEIVMTARLAGNVISNAQNGAIRAMRGPAPIGPDLAVVRRRISLRAQP